MDQWLAQIYGTNGGEDIEKTAQYMLLEKLAQEENVDLSGLNPEQLDLLAQQVSQQALTAQQGQAQPGQEAMPEGVDPELLALVEQLRSQGLDDSQIESFLVEQFGGAEGQEAPVQEAPQAGAQVAPEVAPQQAAPQAQAPAPQAGQPQQGQGQGQGMLANLVAQQFNQNARQQPQAAQPQLGQQEAAPSQEQIQKEAQAKFDEADFLGRVMAHAYFQELRSISSESEKTAGVGEIARHAAHIGGGAALGAAGGAVGGATQGYLTGGDVGKAAKRNAVLGGLAGAGGGHMIHRAGGIQKAIPAALEAAEGLGKTAGQAAIDALVQARAVELLRANGYKF